MRSKDNAASSGITTVQQPQFEQVVGMPSQQNGHDCGLYVCAVADALLQLASKQQGHESSSTADGSSLQGRQQQDLSTAGISSSGSTGCDDWETQERSALQAISSSSVTQLRRDMQSLIHQLAAHGCAQK